MVARYYQMVVKCRAMAHSGRPRRRSSLLFDLFAASQRVKSLLTAAMADSPLTADEYAVYSGVFEFGPIAPTDLAAVAGLPATTLSHYVVAMRERGHIAEWRNPLDGRSRMLTLTAAGLAAHRGASREFERAYHLFAARIADEPGVKESLEAVERAATGALAELDSPSRHARRTRVIPSRVAPGSQPNTRVAGGAANTIHSRSD
jgi:DNA-binding MarR family transcriptional regulator